VCLPHGIPLGTQHALAILKSPTPPHPTVLSLMRRCSNRASETMYRKSQAKPWAMAPPSHRGHHQPASSCMLPPSGRPTSFPLIEIKHIFCSDFSHNERKRIHRSEKPAFWHWPRSTRAAAVAVRRQKAAVPVVKAPKARRKAYAADAITDYLFTRRNRQSCVGYYLSPLASSLARSCVRACAGAPPPPHPYPTPLHSTTGR